VSARSALEELDFAALLAELRNQETHGHTAETDLDRPIGFFADKAREFAVQLGDVVRPGERQNLEVAYRRAARLAAFGLSAMRRIKAERPCNTPAKAAPCDHAGAIYRNHAAGPFAFTCGKCHLTLDERELRKRGPL
jgi:hypothetical protein